MIINILFTILGLLLGWICGVTCGLYIEQKHRKKLYDNKTNGDVIKSVFPNAIIENEDLYLVDVSLPDNRGVMTFKNPWWNALYEKGDK